MSFMGKIIEKIIFTASAEEGKILQHNYSTFRGKVSSNYISSKQAAYLCIQDHVEISLINIPKPKNHTRSRNPNHIGTEHQQDRSDSNTQAGEQTQVGQIRGTGVGYR